MSIWRSLQSIEALNSNRQGTLIATLGILFTEIGEDYIRGTMPVDARTVQPYGLLHGGASVALAETLGSMGAAMCVDCRNTSFWARRSMPTTSARRAAGW